MTFLHQKKTKKMAAILAAKITLYGLSLTVR